jgi:hypothetical protein
MPHIDGTGKMRVENDLLQRVAGLPIGEWCCVGEWPADQLPPESLRWVMQAADRNMVHACLKRVPPPPGRTIGTMRQYVRRRRT